jgi:SMC interacting uncharacterized protein involved in chromosome segregation
MLSKISIFSLFIFLGISFYSNAQTMNAEEKKQLKKQIKSYVKDPERFKKEQEAMMAQMAEQRDKLKDVKEEKDKIQEDLNSKEEEIASLKGEISELQQKINVGSGSNTNNTNAQPCGSGQFKVQIGKFDKFSLNSYLDKGKCIMYENQGGTNVYTIEGFNDAREAFNMAQELRRMGLAGAFVTKFVNNQRVAYDHVSETGEQPYYGTKTKISSSKPTNVTSSNPNQPVYINTGYTSKSSGSAGSTNPEIQKLQENGDEEIIEEIPTEEENKKEEENFKEEKPSDSESSDDTGVEEIPE